MSEDTMSEDGRSCTDQLPQNNGREPLTAALLGDIFFLTVNDYRFLLYLLTHL